MFDTNFFKKKVKEWIKNNPQGKEQELLDFCEELIPAPQFAANTWLIDQTLSWYRHVVTQREASYIPEGDDDSA